MVARPRNHLTCSYGTPKEMENSPFSDPSTRAEHQNVPCGVSVYWKWDSNRLVPENACRAEKNRQALCPSTAPLWSVGNCNPSFCHALWMIPEECTFSKWVGMPKWWVIKLVIRCAAVSWDTANASRRSSTDNSRWDLARPSRSTAEASGIIRAAAK